MNDAYCFDGRKEGFHCGFFGCLGLGGWRDFVRELVMMYLLMERDFECMVVVDLMLQEGEDQRVRLA